ncbi:hypothetical protein DFH09DRAFT_1098856 [Mycena vulgaris]|nr:hypothetical protein DFH09DRAFT_1098856 [Mycena vulgaris]
MYFLFDLTATKTKDTGVGTSRTTPSKATRLVITQLRCTPGEKPGNGRWSMPLYILKSTKFMKRVQALGKQPVQDVEHLQGSEHNPHENIQTLWAKFKTDITDHGKYCSRFITNETPQQIRTLKTQLSDGLHDDEMPAEDRSVAAYLLEKKITDRVREEAETNRSHGMMLKMIPVVGAVSEAKSSSPHHGIIIFEI